MTASMHPSISACPACAAAPAAEDLAERALKPTQIALSLPTIHCSACISKIERGLNAHPGVRSARVNLTLKRASIDAAPEVSAEEMRSLVEGLGFEAHELDGAALGATATDRAGRDLLMRLAVAGFASMNVMLLSVSVWSGAEDATLGRAVQGAAQYGCADHAGDRAGDFHIDLGNGFVGQACLFRRGARADVFPFGGALS